MWFKNIQLFRLAEPFNLSAEQLEEKLSQYKMRPCGSVEMSTFGWVSPFNKDDAVLVHSSNGCILFTACKEERVLPSSVINDELAKKIADIEKNQGRTVYRKEKQQMKEEITFTLMQQAFTKQKRTMAYIDQKLGLLVVDSSSRNKADELVALLRQTLGSLKITSIIIAKSDPSFVMTYWLLHGTNPSDFNIEDSCTLLDRDGGQIKCQRQDLTSEEVQAHLRADKQVMKLALMWAYKLSFVLNQDLSISRIRCLDLLTKSDVNPETPEEQLDADFTLMTLELAELFKLLFKAFEREI